MTYNLTDIDTVKKLLSRQGFTFSKSLGQNFITDPAVCPKMAALCGATKADGVLEIGPGAGVLTVELAKVAKKVVSVELDPRLLPVLAQTLDEYRNVEILCQDILKTDLAALLQTHFADCARVFICANLPYYITSPVLTFLLESGCPFAGITVMVQKEAAERLCAEVGSRASGAITVAVRYRSEPELLFAVKNTSFTPPPKVDSYVIRLTPRNTPPVTLRNEAFFFRTVRAAFSQRRKTAANGLSSCLGFPKDAIFAALEAMGLPPTTRAEALTLEQFAALSDMLYENR